MLPPNSPVLTQDFVSFIEEQRVAWNIPGISVGIVRLDGGTETRGLGVMNADGDEVTAEVQPPGCNGGLSHFRKVALRQRNALQSKHDGARVYMSKLCLAVSAGLRPGCRDPGQCHAV
jgi:hypothetical protein